MSLKSDFNSKKISIYQNGVQFSHRLAHHFDLLSSLRSPASPAQEDSFSNRGFGGDMPNSTRIRLPKDHPTGFFSRRREAEEVKSKFEEPRSDALK